MVRLPEQADQTSRHLGRAIRVRVAIGAPGPVNPSQGVSGAPGWVLHVEQGRKVVLLRVARIGLLARQSEPVPELTVPDHGQCVGSGQDEKLRADPELVEGYFGQHGGVRVAAGRVPVP